MFEGWIERVEMEIRWYRTAMFPVIFALDAGDFVMVG